MSRIAPTPADDNTDTLCTLPTLSSQRWRNVGCYGFFIPCMSGLMTGALACVPGGNASFCVFAAICCTSEIMVAAQNVSFIRNASIFTQPTPITAPAARELQQPGENAPLLRPRQGGAL